MLKKLFFAFIIMTTHHIYAHNSERTFGGTNMALLVSALGGTAITMKGLKNKEYYAAFSARFTAASTGALLINTCYSNRSTLTEQSRSFYAGVALLFVTICSCLTIGNQENIENKDKACIKN